MCYAPGNTDMLSTEDFKLNLEKPSAAKKTVLIKRVSVKEDLTVYVKVLILALLRI